MSQDARREVVIRPQDFIHGPYVSCPRCGAAESFGVIIVSDRSYTRRCMRCLVAEPFALPPLTKKLVYLDQFAVSDMMKAINPESKANREGRVDPFWRELFETLDRLCRLQLIACPHSQFHEHESAVSPFRDSLKSLNQLLSEEVEFQSTAWIQVLQIHDQVTKWVRGEDAAQVAVERRDALRGDPSAWTDVFIVSVDLGDPEGYIEDLRRSRDRIQGLIARIFERWRAEPKTFDEYFLEESRSWAMATLLQYKKYRERLRDMWEGRVPPTPDVLSRPVAADVIRAIKDALERSGVARGDVWPKLLEYLASGLVDRLPFNRLNAALWATLATQARDRAAPPGRGMTNDIQMISTLLPYCDAMYVDRECHGLLKNMPASHRPNYACQVFSAANKGDFLAYLRSIEAAAPGEHLAKVREVYGDGIAEMSRLNPA